MEEELKTRLDVQEKKLDAIYVSVEKTRKYFLWTFIATIIAFVLPLIGIAIVVPMMLGPLMSAYSI
jgi:type IV secretory pathway component VirB8